MAAVPGQCCLRRSVYNSKGYDFSLVDPPRHKNETADKKASPLTKEMEELMRVEIDGTCLLFERGSGSGGEDAGLPLFLASEGHEADHVGTACLLNNHG